MIFIVGGAFNEKLEFALKLKYDKISEDEKQDIIFDCSKIDHYSNFFDKLPKKKIIYNFHDYIRQMLLKKIDISNKEILRSELEKLKSSCIKEIKQSNADIIIMDEVGCGVVPLDKTDRIYRELVGRVGSEISAISKEVYRVTAGIGIRIK